MSYIPFRSGFTGPAAKIGGSTDYHIDLKARSNLPIAEQVKAFDTLVKQYQSHGREVEFSNANVSGMRWNPAASFDDKVKLYNQAVSAHSHSMHPGWNSLDFYVPFKGKDRFAKGAVEGASIYAPGIPGGKIRRASGGGFGYYSEVLDPKGQVMFKVGHGDISRPEEKAEIDVPQLEQQSLPVESNQSNENALANSMLQMYLMGLGVSKQKQETPTDRMKTQLLGQILTPKRNPLLERYLTEESPYSFLET